MKSTQKLIFQDLDCYLLRGNEYNWSYNVTRIETTNPVRSASQCNKHVGGRKCNIKICKRTTKIQRVEKGKDVINYKEPDDQGGTFSFNICIFFFFGEQR